jgi:hypothetical protein
MNATIELISSVVLRILRAFKILPPASGPPADSAGETQSEWLLKRAGLTAKDRALLEAFEDSTRDPHLKFCLVHSTPLDPVLQKRLTLLAALGFIYPVQKGRHPAWAITDEYEFWMPGPPHPHTEFKNP